jgi:UrcA family protein
MKLFVNKKTIAIALSFNLLAGTSTLLQATLSDVDVKSTKVSYQDLNLRQVEDQRTLLERLEDAARKVCGIREVRTVREIKQSRDCADQAVSEAIDDIGNADLMALQLQ